MSIKKKRRKKRALWLYELEVHRVVNGQLQDAVVGMTLVSDSASIDSVAFHLINQPMYLDHIEPGADDVRVGRVRSIRCVRQIYVQVFGDNPQQMM